MSNFPSLLSNDLSFKCYCKWATERCLLSSLSSYNSEVEADTHFMHVWAFSVYLNLQCPWIPCCHYMSGHPYMSCERIRLFERRGCTLWFVWLTVEKVEMVQCVWELRRECSMSGCVSICYLIHPYPLTSSLALSIVRVGVYRGRVGERVERTAEVGLQWASHTHQQKWQHQWRVKLTSPLIPTYIHSYKHIALQYR